MNYYSIELLLIGTLTACIGQPIQGVERITVTQVKEQAIGTDVQLIDVRRSEEYTQGYIGDAVNISIADVNFFRREIAKLDTAKPIYLYCHSGFRSHKASKIVKALGFQTIYDFSGGWKVWVQQHNAK